MPAKGDDVVPRTSRSGNGWQVGAEADGDEVEEEEVEEEEVEEKVRI